MYSPFHFLISIWKDVIKWQNHSLLWTIYHIIMNTIGCIYVKCMIASCDELWLQANRHFCHPPDTIILNLLTFKKQQTKKNPNKQNKKKGQSGAQRWWQQKHLNQAAVENYHILAGQPFAESKVTGACILENANLLQICPIWTKKVSKPWNLNFFQAMKFKLFPVLVLHLETSTTLFQHTLLFFSHNAGNTWKWQKKILVLSRRVTGKWHLVWGIKESGPAKRWSGTAGAISMFGYQWGTLTTVS